jgi:hypothetical protein
MSVTAIQETASGDNRAEASRTRRVDAPHVVAHSLPLEKAGGSESEEPLGQALLEVAEEPSPSLTAAVAGESLELRREQLQLQVSQLAGHLRERLREVDRREAAVNARSSQLEADLRASRMWLRERENEFQQREQELRRQIEELEDRVASATDAPEATASHLPTPLAEEGPGARGHNAPDFEARQQELAERENQNQLRESDLRERRFEHDRQSAALRHAQQLWEHQRSRAEQDLAQERSRLETEFQDLIAQREAELKSSEQLLAEHAALLDRDRAELIADRRAWEEHKSRQRQELDAQKESVLADLNDRQQRLDARQEWIERQKAGLEQVRSEILGLHRQSLEMRLIAEQLWSQITGRLAPADVTQAVAQLRLKLTEHYKLEEQGLDAKRDELVALGERITAQHAELKQLQAGLREWTATRQAEIEEQAAALVERELALDADEEQHRQAQHAWQSDRRRFEQQIRDLTAQLRAVPFGN